MAVPEARERSKAVIKMEETSEKNKDYLVEK